MRRLLSLALVALALVFSAGCGDYDFFDDFAASQSSVQQADLAGE